MIRIQSLITVHFLLCLKNTICLIPVDQTQALAFLNHCISQITAPRIRNIFGIDIRNFIFILPDIKANEPIPILIINNISFYFKFDTFILDIGKINLCSLQACTQRHSISIQQTIRFLFIKT